MSIFVEKKIKQLIVIQGPTASGKTALSIALAKELQTVILSADSRQFYREIGIGTAKPTLEERGDVPHFFIDSHSLEEPVSAAQFEREALKILTEEFQQHDQIILVGGSGMFIDALTFGLDPLPTDKEIQNKYSQLLKESGIEELQKLLHSLDPEYYQKVDRNNPHRLIRALELIELTGRKMDEIRKGEQQERFFESKRFVLDPPRQELYERINQRVDAMLIDGLLDEVKSVMHLRQLQSLNTVGYKELFAYLDGTCTLEEAKAAIQQNSRRYAKRQMTWFRRNPEDQFITEMNLQKRMQFILNELAK